MKDRLGKPPFIPETCESCPIRAATVCGGLPGDRVDVVQRFKTGDRILPAGKDLFREGDQCAELYNLLDGWVALYQIAQNGRRQILDFVLPGGFIGYQPDLSDPMAFGATCLTDVSVCVFPRRRFHGLIDAHPGLARRLTAISSAKTMAGYEALTNIGCRSAQARIAHLLLTLFVHIVRNLDERPLREVRIPLTQNDIADALGLTSVYVSQTLKQLRNMGLLVFRNGHLQILDPNKLAEIADFNYRLVVGD